jgi:5-methylcytosine-specific restriction enzyme A
MNRTRLNKAMTARVANPAAAKNPRKVWYGTQLWKNRRADQLAKEPICALCFAKGEITSATVADHIEPHKGNYNAFVLGPLRSLCAPCHDALQGFTHKGYSREIGLDGYPIDLAHPFNRQR